MRHKILSGDKWYYHPEKEAEVKWREDEAKHYAEGWCDTPDDFPSEYEYEETNIEPPVDGVNEKVPVFDDMTRKEVRAYGRDQGVELAWKSKDAMLEDLIKHLEG